MWSLAIKVEQLWLGYDGLTVQFTTIVAVLHYRSSFNGQIVAGWGRVPANIRAVVVIEDGQYLPSSRAPEELRLRIAAWRDAHERAAGM